MKLWNRGKIYSCKIKTLLLHYIYHHPKSCTLSLVNVAVVFDTFTAVINTSSVIGGALKGALYKASNIIARGSYFKSINCYHAG